MPIDQATTANETSRNAFPALRMLCALVVVYEHTAWLTGSSLPYTSGGQGRELAVNVFFILSGYWVYHSFLQSRSTGAFFAKRVRHIFPLHLLILFLTVIVGGFFSTLSLKAYFTDPLVYRFLLCNSVFLNFIQDFLPGLADGGTLTGALWTLRVEWILYLFLPLLVLLMARLAGNDRKKRDRILGLLFLVTAILTAVIYVLFDQLRVPSNAIYQPHRELMFFVCGMFWYEHRERTLRLKSPVTIAVLALFAFCLWRQGVWFHILMAPVLTYLSALFCTKARPFFRYPRQWDLSYPLYLLHMPVIQIVRSTGILSGHMAGGIACIWIITILLAIILHQLENRITRKGTSAESR